MSNASRAIFLLLAARQNAFYAWTRADSKRTFKHAFGVWVRCCNAVTYLQGATR